MNRHIIKYITNPLWEFAARRKRLPILKNLERSQHLKTKELVEIQQKKLNALIMHAYSTVPYYRKMMDSLNLKPEQIKNIDDLAKMPILTKELIADNFEELKSKNIKKYRPIPYSTGGTSGRHLQFITSGNTLDAHMAAAYRAWRWAGWNFGVKYAYIWGASRDLANETTIKKKVKNLLTENRLLIQGLIFTDESLERDCRRLMKFQPEVIITYPSSLVIIARYMQKHKIELSVKSIITSSEKLFPWQRSLFEKVFKAKVYDDYGGRESSIRATQCEMGNYHISSENGVLETVRSGKQVIQKPGRVLLTEFNNYAMPLIRYENTDVAVLTGKACPCQRGLPLLDEIQGRISDIFITKDGKYMPAEFFMVAFLNFSGEFYQVVQESKESINIKIVKGKHFKPEDIKKVKKHFKEWLGNNVKINILYIKDIPQTPGGKRRYFISKVPLDF